MLFFHKTFLVHPALIFLFFLTACEQPKAKKEIVKKPLVLAKSPDFQADSAYFFIEKQISFGARIPNSAAHDTCGDFLIATFKKYKAEVTVQNFIAEGFDGSKLASRNIIATYFPKASKRILLAAHWDTRPFSDQDADKNQHNKPIAGANDGGSGVAVLLEIARILSGDSSANVGVDIILFDSEDYGMPEFAKASDFPGYDENKQYYCLGSQYWAKNKHKTDYSAYYGILLDMVGAKNATFAREGSSVKYAGEVVNKVWETAKMLGYSQYFIDYQASQIIDDHVFVNRDAKIPMIDVIEHKMGNENYFGHYWHTQQDNLQIIDKQTLKAVGQTVLQVLYQERNAE
jgi:glutaminyl-peptide cyclotransferase